MVGFQVLNLMNESSSGFRKSDPFEIKRKMSRKEAMKVINMDSIWTHHLKMNSGTRSATFLNDHTVVTSGVDADIYLWDLRQSGRCMNR